MQRKAKSLDERKYWQDVAMAVARIGRKRVAPDGATASAIDTDFGGAGEGATREHEPRKADPIEDLKRIVGGQGTEPASRRPGTPANSTRRKRPERR